MNEYELVATVQKILSTAAEAIHAGNSEAYASNMTAVLDLLIEELVSSPPAARSAPSTAFNPERILQEISIAIKHRTYSSSERWNIVYYRDRLTCVPSYINIPPEIILSEFTERMLQKGFSAIYWNQLKQNVIKLYKELQK